MSWQYLFRFLVRRRALQIETDGGCIKAWQIYAFMTDRPNIGEFFSEHFVWHLETLLSILKVLKYDFHFSQHLFSYLFGSVFHVFNLEKSPKALREILEI